MIEMRVSDSDGLKVHTEIVYRGNDLFRIIAWIDADRLPGVFTSDDPGMLLKSCDCNFFDDHFVAWLVCQTIAYLSFSNLFALNSGAECWERRRPRLQAAVHSTYW